MKYISKLFLSTRASDRRRFFLPAGDRVQKFTKPAKTGNCKKKKNNCRLYYLRRNRKISKTVAGFDGLAKPTTVACRFSNFIKFLSLQYDSYTVIIYEIICVALIFSYLENIIKIVLYNLDSSTIIDHDSQLMEVIKTII